MNDNTVSYSPLILFLVGMSIFACALSSFGDLLRTLDECVEKISTIEEKIVKYKNNYDELNRANKKVISGLKNDHKKLLDLLKKTEEKLCEKNNELAEKVENKLKERNASPKKCINSHIAVYHDYYLYKKGGIKMDKVRFLTKQYFTYIDDETSTSCVDSKYLLKTKNNVPTLNSYVPDYDLCKYISVILDTDGNIYPSMHVDKKLVEHSSISKIDVKGKMGDIIGDCFLVNIYVTTYGVEKKLDFYGQDVFVIGDL